MKEKLIIKNFGPIKSVELELGRFNVLIGEQATGKSTVAKLLAVCRYFSYIVGDGPIINKDSNLFYQGLTAWGLDGYVKNNTYLYYHCEHYFFEVKNMGKDYVEDDSATDEQNHSTHIAFEINLNPLSEHFKNLLSDLKNIVPNIKIGTEYPMSVLNWRIPASFFQNNVAAVLDNPFYLPTERGLQSIFSLGKSSIQNISDSLFNQFARIDQIARLFGSDTDIVPLDIVYKNEQGKGFIRKNNENRFFSLFNAASGYQSTIPIVLLTKYYSEMRNKKKTFIIEEPELNLFPDTQQKLMQFLINSTVNYGHSMLLTTHSPYILTSLNNMMYAYQMGQIDSNETEKIIKKQYWQDPDDVSAYMLYPDGTAANIIDQEIKQIMTEKIDEVSRSLNEDFDEMSDIKYAQKL